MNFKIRPIAAFIKTPFKNKTTALSGWNSGIRMLQNSIQNNPSVISLGNFNIPNWTLVPSDITVYWYPEMGLSNASNKPSFHLQLCKYRFLSVILVAASITRCVLNFKPKMLLIVTIFLMTSSNSICYLKAIRQDHTISNYNKCPEVKEAPTLTVQAMFFSNCFILFGCY